MSDEPAKIQHSEIERLFGQNIPIGAVDILFRSPDDMSLAEVRAKIVEFAKALDEAPHPMTTQWLMHVVSQRRLRFWPTRSCSICGSPIGYLFSPDGTELAFDPTCDCGSRSYGPERRHWGDLAEAFNMQTSRDVFDRMVTEFRTAGESYPS